MCNMSEYGKRKDMDNNEVTTALPNVKWKIMDADRAKEHRLELIKIDDDNVLLSINLRYISHWNDNHRFHREHHSNWYSNHRQKRITLWHKKTFPT